MIRKANSTDLPAINDIYNQAVKTKSTGDITPVSMEDRQVWFESHPAESYPVFVFEQDNKIKGWLSFSAYRPGRQALRHTAEISYYVNKDDLQKGIGTALVQFVIKTAPEYSFKNLFAIILENNVASIRLMEKLGFKKWGHLPEIADFNGEPCGQYYYGLKVLPIKGKPIDIDTRCVHYHSPLDVIAIKFKCCDQYYPCYYCHLENAGHDAAVWSKNERAVKAVLCGICKNEMTIAEYLDSNNKCLFCKASFNPNCKNHHHLYFEI